MVFFTCFAADIHESLNFSVAIAQEKCYNIRSNMKGGGSLDKNRYKIADRLYDG